MSDYWSDEELLQRMAGGWKHAAEPSSVCGRGSTMANTAAVRAWLPQICERYGIRSVCDAGAGDLSWIRMVEWDVDYRPFDLIRWHQDVTELDITREALPACDLILCRYVLVHLDPPRIERAIELFRQSGRYLAATHYEPGVPFGRTSPFNRLNMRPWLGEPIDSIVDCDQDCRLALWPLAQGERVG